MWLVSIFHYYLAPVVYLSPMYRRVTLIYASSHLSFTSRRCTGELPSSTLPRTCRLPLADVPASYPPLRFLAPVVYLSPMYRRVTLLYASSHLSFTSRRCTGELPSSTLPRTCRLPPADVPTSYPPLRFLAPVVYLSPMYRRVTLLYASLRLRETLYIAYAHIQSISGIRASPSGTFPGSSSSFSGFPIDSIFRGPPGALFLLLI